MAASLRRCCIGSILGLLLVPLVVVPAEGATPGGLRSIPGACWTEEAPPFGCQDGRALKDFFNELEISPDGRHIYTQGAYGDNVGIFDRNADTGAVTQKAGANGCVVDEDWDTDTGQDAALSNKEECGETEGLNDPAGMDMSADGRHVYVVSRQDDSIVVFSRDTTSGVLTAASCTAWAGTGATDNGCPKTGRRMRGLVSVAVSPDGENVYAVSDTTPVVLVFRRDADSGALTQRPGSAGCFAPVATEGCTVEPALANPRRLVVTEGQVYVADYGRGVYGFARDRSAGAARGDLTILPKGAGGCLADTAAAGCQAVPALAGDPVDLELGRDGTKLYVISGHGQRLNTLTRREDGTLTPLACLTETAETACPTAVPSLGFLHAVTIAPDGSTLYVGSFFGGRRMTAFDIPSDGVPRLRSGIAGCATPAGEGGCAAVPQLDYMADLVSSADGRHLYATGARRLVGFARDQPPVCEAVQAEVNAGSAVTVALRCMDPDNDPVSLELLQQGTKGVASTPGSDGRATYSAAASASGQDQFTYRGTAHGGSSDAATATISIKSAPPGGGGGIPDPDRDGDGVPGSLDCDDLDPERKPTLREVPGNAKDENCDQIVAPFPLLGASVSFTGRAYRASARYPRSFTQILAMKVLNLAGGERITFRCKARGKACRKPTKLKAVTVKKAGTLVLTKPFRGRRLLPGSTLEVRITRPGWRGRSTLLTVRRGTSRKGRDPSIVRRCLAEGTGAVVPCT